LPRRERARDAAAVVVVGVVCCVLLAYALLSRRLEGTVVSAAMFFVSAGLLAGWTGSVDLGAAAHAGTGEEASRAAVLLVAELALVLLLFGDAAGIDLRTLRRNALPVRLLRSGCP
jgi:sodium/hydrogen antiporter